jgi:hypothetical protein
MNHRNSAANRRRLAAVCVALAPAFAAGEYTSGTRDVLSANTGTWNAAGVTLNGTQFIVQGLQGLGRVSASATQTLGGVTETLGSISDMQITDWSFDAESGNYSGTFHFLPDRGYNAGSLYSNYAARINQFAFTFTPHTSNAITASQNQIQLTYTGATQFTYDHDGNSSTAPILSTGLVANSAATSFAGTAIPTVTTATTIGSDGPIANRLTLDTEGLVLDPRAGKQGSGWVSDEYGAYIYHFNASKEIDGIVAIPAALIPHKPAGTTYFTDSPANVDGRRVNQGMEGLAISPDGTKLFAMLQSATIQDSASGNQGRTTTRVLEYDLSGGDVPTDPSAQYVLQLPRIDTDLSGTVDRAGAQSAITAISDHELLILSRDGNGRGADSAAPVFKSVLLADLSAGTNIDGLYDAAGARVTTAAGSDVPASGIVAVPWTEALNMLGKLDLSVTELEQFGLNLLANDGDANTLSEKWEALALVPTLDGHVNDYFLFLGNDNDFQTATGWLTLADGSAFGYDAGLENDTMLQAWRVTVAPVPVPGAVWLLGSALLPLIARRRGGASRRNATIA